MEVDQFTHFMESHGFIKLYNLVPMKDRIYHNPIWAHTSGGFFRESYARKMYAGGDWLPVPF
jgi:hypothetical protein